MERASRRDKWRTFFATTSLIFKITSTVQVYGREAVLEAEGVDPAVIRLVKYSTIEPSCRRWSTIKKEKNVEI